MTAIVGMVRDGNVWIGGDSAGVAGLSISSRRDPKVFVVDGFVFGFTSSFRMGQLLMHRFKPPKCKADRDLFEYMVTDFIDAVRAVFSDGGFAKKENNVETGGTFLVGFRGRLFCIASDFQVGEPECGFDAVGCGDHLALGALFALNEREDVDPSDAILTALYAAAEFSAGVCAPFTLKGVDIKGRSPFEHGKDVKR